MPPTTISAGKGLTGVSSPLWRRVFQNRQSARPPTDNAPSIASHSIAALPNTNKPLLFSSEPEVVHNVQTIPTPAHPGPNEDIITYVQKPMPPKWSVVYHPEVKRALNLHLAHTFTIDSSVYCIHMSPDGQRLAVGGDGKTYLNELQTGSNIWLVSKPLV